MTVVLPPLRFGLPPIGIGTYELRGEACTEAVRAALQMGYRLIDTAAVYRNEELVGEGIATSGVPRAELFVIVKIAMKSMGADAAVRQGILDSIHKLRIHYADCVLMHWPGCGGLKPQDAAGHQAARARCWRIMKELQSEGKVRYLGVSNFLPRHFAELQLPTEAAAGNHENTSAASTQDHICSPSSQSKLYDRPILNQVELHPLCVQRDVDVYCRGEHGMLLQQYSPLGKGDARLLQHPKLLEVHAQHFAASLYSVQDVLLMWGLSQGYCTLVRSHKAEHLRANLRAAWAYFDVPDGGGAAATWDVVPSRPLLTQEQRVVLASLRQQIGVEEATDVHLCWYSSEIA